MLVLAYYSWKDPVFQSAVLPYFLNDTRQGLQIVLVTFESLERQLTKQELVSAKLLCKENNIIWERLTWRSGKFKFLKKGVDFVQSIYSIGKLIQLHNVERIYSEGFPGAILGYYLSNLYKLKHSVHTFEPHSDYMLESGIWEKTSWEYQLNRYFERKIAQSSEYILTATDAYIKLWKNKTTSTKFVRVPSCVDYKVYKYSEKLRNQLRNRLGYTSNDKVLVYLGKKEGMYWSESFLKSFFKVICNEIDDLKLLIISLDEFPTLSLNERVNVISSKKEDVGGYLSASDLAVCGIKPIPSRRYSSPIKNGEYWANGLNVIIPKGISDDYLFTEKKDIGLVFDIENESFEDLVQRVRDKHWLFKRNPLAADFVQEDRGIEKYKKLYGKIFNFS